MTDQQLDIATLSDARPLLVACTDDAKRRSVEDLFAAATPAPAITWCEGVEAALAQDATAPVVVPVTLPLDYLAAALQAGTAPDDALADWSAEAEALLRACRKARRRVLLIDAGKLATQPETGARALGARLGLQFSPMPPTHEAVRSPIHAVIAGPLLASDAKASDLLDEIEAMIVGPLTARNPDRTEIVSATDAAATLIEERDLLRENLAQMLAETEELRNMLTRKEQEVSALEQQQAQVSDLENRLAQADTERKSLIEERDLLRENLAQMLEETDRLLGNENDRKRELEARNTALADKHLLKAQLEAVTRQLDTANDEINRIYASNSWKVTAPLRAARRGLHRP